MLRSTLRDPMIRVPPKGRLWETFNVKTMASEGVYGVAAPAAGLKPSSNRELSQNNPCAILKSDFWQSLQPSGSLDYP